MTIKKIIFGLLITIVGLIIIGTIYLFNDDKFYSEYWLQRQIDNLPLTETRGKQLEAEEMIRYKFFFDSSVDLSIELDNKGNLILKRHSWFADSRQLKEYNFKVDENEFRKIKTDFKARWTESMTKDVDDKLGGIYYELEMLDPNSPEREINVGFYNVTPDKSFMELKDRMIQLAKSELEK